MGIIKGCLKLVGSVTLGATGVASTVLKGVCDTVGIGLGSEVFGAAKDASFGGVRKMWDSDSAQERIDEVQDYTYNMEDTTRKKMAETAYQAAQIAKKNGDQKKYERYMEKYEMYK